MLSTSQDFASIPTHVAPAGSLAQIRDPECASPRNLTCNADGERESPYKHLPAFRGKIALPATPLPESSVADGSISASGPAKSGVLLKAARAAEHTADAESKEVPSFHGRVGLPIPPVCESSASTQHIDADACGAPSDGSPVSEVHNRDLKTGGGGDSLLRKRSCRWETSRPRRSDAQRCGTSKDGAPLVTMECPSHPPSPQLFADSAATEAHHCEPEPECDDDARDQSSFGCEAEGANMCSKLGTNSDPDLANRDTIIAVDDSCASEAKSSHHSMICERDPARDSSDHPVQLFVPADPPTSIGTHRACGADHQCEPEGDAPAPGATSRPCGARACHSSPSSVKNSQALASCSGQAVVQQRLPNLLNGCSAPAAATHSQSYRSAASTCPQITSASQKARHDVEGVHMDRVTDAKLRRPLQQRMGGELDCTQADSAKARDVSTDTCSAPCKTFLCKCFRVSFFGGAGSQRDSAQSLHEAEQLRLSALSMRNEAEQWKAEAVLWQNHTKERERDADRWRCAAVHWQVEAEAKARKIERVKGDAERWRSQAEYWQQQSDRSPQRQRNLDGEARLRSPEGRRREYKKSARSVERSREHTELAERKTRDRSHESQRDMTDSCSSSPLDAALASLSDRHPEVRRATVEALGRGAGKGVVPAARRANAAARLLGDESASVRAAAAVALGRMGGEAAAAHEVALAALIEDEDAGVRAAAAEVLRLPTGGVARAHVAAPKLASTRARTCEAAAPARRTQDPVGGKAFSPHGRSFSEEEKEWEVDEEEGARLPHGRGEASRGAARNVMFEAPLVGGSSGRPASSSTLPPSTQQLESARKPRDPIGCKDATPQAASLSEEEAEGVVEEEEAARPPHGGGGALRGGVRTVMLEKPLIGRGSDRSARSLAPTPTTPNKGKATAIPDRTDPFPEDAEKEDVATAVCCEGDGLVGREDDEHEDSGIAFI